MIISAICGSSSTDSSNLRVLHAIERLFPDVDFQFPIIVELPLFRVAMDTHPCTDEVTTFRKQIESSDAVLICTPEYLHNIPAVLKNAMEWLTSSGEMYHKRVIPMTHTSMMPRGEKAMLSLTNTLIALDTNIITSLSIYHSDVNVRGDVIEFLDDMTVMLQEAMSLLRS